ncbi:MAG: hypothetical protein ONB48_21260 [candidate division KSB1 bacterium]|nr:hypothetical protein [candidate division KSB1 bacterium]MDZ7288177.1 hypothetical protein [candidate division KSB1 bacterium]MDZ7300310.1 hypothetical protein [candidate division KSB1 bacterium]MDZ7308731.1 hypothetical protein [candidate division KSB1 bacterium]MDZ7351310.1 hypothetical protein [candidate division KSB1 bacterium]
MRAVVERYDGDGSGDMPGLTIPICFYLMPGGRTKLVSSSAVLRDLYADFPDYPAFDSTDGLIWRRLNGQNFHGVSYARGWSDLKKLLAGLGDDRNGTACDYLGWHPHFS